MENSRIHGRHLLLRFLQGFVLLCMSTRLESATLAKSTSGKESDRLALLDLKKGIAKDPLHVMSSWNASTDFCSWVGVTCNHSAKRVMILNLQAQKLVGSLPHSIGNLTFLTKIHLGENYFHGEIPQEIGRLRSLSYLNLTSNSFSGTLPANMSHCTQLRVLDVFSNELIGSIPNQLGSLLRLTHLQLGLNNLTGIIPYWIGNFSSLNTLFLHRNNFQGSIPNELGRLTGLRIFSPAENNLSGMVPSSIYNISSLYLIRLSLNQLHGELPPNLGINLPNLIRFIIAANKFTGNIPGSLSNASRLQFLNIAKNGFTGALPAENLARLRGLVWLGLEFNRLGSGRTGDLNFLNFLANCTSLEVLALTGNNFGGELPGSIANFSTTLRLLVMGVNLIHGSIPNGIENLVNLTILVVEGNNFGGSIPDGIGKLNKLGVLYLNDNKFSGPIPSSLGNLTLLTQLTMENNRLQGSIPPTLGNCQNLLVLNLSINNLTGTIPKELVGISSLSISLTMFNNSLIGSLPSEVGDLVHLTELDVSGNKLTGEIPKSLGKCTSLVSLHLESNQFDGQIPQSLKDLRGLEEIDLSCNKLSGQLPEFLGKFQALKLLNLSHNDFAGELPREGIFTNASGVSIFGNFRLCGGIAQFLLPACPKVKPHSSQRPFSRKVVILIACAFAFIIALSCSIAIYSKVKKSRGLPVTSRSYKDWKSGVSYSELLQSTNGFSVDNLIGSGSFGSVYKGVIPSDGTIVAVKVFNLHQQGSFKSFIDECKALRSIRHRNLLKIITSCSSINNQGNEFKSLVFEYMVHGSLDSWLYPRAEEQCQIKRLGVIQRLNIAIDVATALDYLHHHCETPIVHCDLKPSNVLLDEDMVAHVGDFGLARFLLETPNDPSQSKTMSTGLKGSMGYIPPEYGMGGQVSILGDIYSYGILLLEMFTGKRPTDDMFRDGLSIHQFTNAALPNHALDVADPSLLLERDDAEANDDRHGSDMQEEPSTRNRDRDPVQERRLEECLVSVMQIGLSCSAISQGERMLMNVVVNKMKSIRDSYLSLRRRS